MSVSFRRKILIAMLAVLGAAFVFMAWYRLHYSMRIAPTFGVAGSPAGS